MADAILALINREFEKAERESVSLELFCWFIKDEFDMLVRNVANPPLTSREEALMPICLDTTPYISGEVARSVLQRYFWGYYRSHKMVLTTLMQRYPRAPEPRRLYEMLASISKDYKQPILDLVTAQKKVEDLKKQLQCAEQEVEELKKNQTV